jgi:hypothetical protein
VRSISERYWLLRNEGDSHPLFRMSEKKWERRIRELAAEAQQTGPEGDSALIELCRIDPRFMTTNLVIAKMLDWELQVVFGDIRSAKPVQARRAKPSAEEIEARKASEERHRLSRIRVETARKNLKNLADAVAYVTGKGNKGYQLRQQLKSSFNFYVALFTELRAKLRSKFTDAKVRKLAAEWDVSEEILRELKDAARVEGLVDRQLATEYRNSPDRIRALRTQGRRKK